MTDIVITKRLIEKHKEAMKSYPYNINIIDELHADENAHSRILMKLLQFNEDKSFPILDSFLKELEIIRDRSLRTLWMTLTFCNN